MKILKCALMTVGLLGGGCRSPWEPQFGLVIGVVRYADMTPVYAAKVWIEGGGSTMTDIVGNYRLELKTPEDTVTVHARDGYTPGMAYAETHSGSARVVMRRNLIVQNIVLDHSDPI